MLTAGQMHADSALAGAAKLRLSRLRLRPAYA